MWRKVGFTASEGGGWLGKMVVVLCSIWLTCRFVGALDFEDGWARSGIALSQG